MIRPYVVLFAIAVVLAGGVRAQATSDAPALSPGARASLGIQRPAR